MKGVRSKPVMLHIKNMVCARCIRVVKEEMEKLGLDVRSVLLGEATIAPGREKIDLARIRAVLRKNGFDLLDDRRVQIVEKIKNAIVKFVHYETRNARNLKASEYIAREVGLEYHFLSSLFSSLENITIEKYLILQRIERVKELLKYDEMTLSEIAYSMGYSSVAHLSNQFRKVTGLSASGYKKMKEHDRKSLDAV